jgi:hypothetical protein
MDGISEYRFTDKGTIAENLGALSCIFSAPIPSCALFFGGVVVWGVRCLQNATY